MPRHEACSAPIANFNPGDSGVRASSSEAPHRAESLRQVADLYRGGKLTVEANDVLPFEYASEVQQATEADTRKVVLIP